ncbi:Papain inhibitor [Leucoagaricus sp. SymC.cos]|nr:Papain inhibitor [Leucoagaricus sp. SymC.cos]
MYATKFLLAAVSSTLLFCHALAKTGDATYFFPGLGACGLQNGNQDLIVALNPADYAGGANCGRSIVVNYQGKSVITKVVDLCPGCGAGGVDLSPAAFQQLASLDLGRIQVNWNFV